MVILKVRGQNTNEKTEKQMAENAIKISGDDGAACITSLVPRVKHAKLRNGLEFYRASRVGFLRQVAYELISADHELFEFLV